MRKSRLFLLTPIIMFALISCKEEKRKKDFPVETATKDNLIKEVIEEIKNNYAEEISEEKLEEGAINGMLSFLDDYSMHISQDEFDAFYKLSRGTFLGTGIEIKRLQDGIEIVSIIDDSPAMNAGLKNLDIITQIDGNEVGSFSMKEIISKLSSDSVLNIKLSVVRNKNEKFEINLKKSIIQIQSVKLNFISDIAIMRISHFNEETVGETKNALKKIIKNKSKGVVLDLRNNPGGLLEQAINFCSLFLDRGKIVEIRSRRAEDSKVFYAKEFDILKGLPMAIVINSNTASGAELAAAALGENKRTIIIGEKSYGKGSLQTVIPIPGRGAMKLTTAYFISPNGNNINQNGVLPDIEITNAIGDSVLQRAVDLLSGISALKAD